MIVEYFQLTGTNVDVLAAPSRLNSLPYNGTLVIEMQASVNEITNFFAVQIQLPDGSTPLEAVRIPEGVNGGSLNIEEKYVVSLPATLGGHIIISATETGVSQLELRCTLMP